MMILTNFAFHYLRSLNLPKKEIIPSSLLNSIPINTPKLEIYKLFTSYLKSTEWKVRRMATLVLALLTQ